MIFKYLLLFNISYDYKIKISYDIKNIYYYSKSVWDKAFT